MKQKTPIRQLIEKLTDDIVVGKEMPPEIFNPNYLLGLCKAKDYAQELESVNEQQIKNAHIHGDQNFIDSVEYRNAAEQYFNETFEKP